VRCETALNRQEGVIEQIRIVLGDLPQLAADMVERVVACQADMVIVGRLRSSTGLLELARMTAPDVVMMELADAELPTGCLALFAENASVTVLGLEKEGGLAHLYQLHPDHHELGEVAPEDLVSQIRFAARRPPFSEWRATPQSPR